MQIFDKYDQISSNNQIVMPTVKKCSFIVNFCWRLFLLQESTLSLFVIFSSLFAQTDHLQMDGTCRGRGHSQASLPVGRARSVWPDPQLWDRAHPEALPALLPRRLRFPQHQQGAEVCFPHDPFIALRIWVCTKSIMFTRLGTERIKQSDVPSSEKGQESRQDCAQEVLNHSK